ncbi:MAG: SCP2 sterol-binding domain-containing protein [Pseudomonadota bacterium]
MTENALIAEAEGFFCDQFDGVVRIEITDEGCAVWVDGRSAPPTISASSPQGLTRQFCLWRVEAADLSVILSGTQARLEHSMVAGRLHVSGDMSVMMRLEKVRHG